MDSILYAWTQYIWPLAMFLIGLSFVVFIHELGHFLAARWAGIRVERFAIGMGPRLIGWQPGETDYCVCAFPLGGYVKMLGQEDFEKRTEGDDADESGEMDPRSFNAVSVGKRFVVVSAGVVMNVLLAPVLLACLLMAGMDKPAPVVGNAAPAYPGALVTISWPDGAPPKTERAGFDAQRDAFVGLLGDDRLDTITGGGFLLRQLKPEVTSFSDLQMRAALAGPEDRFKVHFTRTVAGKAYSGECELWAIRGAGAAMPMFGIAPAYSLTVGNNSAERNASPFVAGDQITAIGDQPVATYRDLQWAMEQLDGTPIDVTVERDGSPVKVTVTPLVSMNPQTHFLLSGQRAVGWPLCNNTSDEAMTFELPTGKEQTTPAQTLAIYTPEQTVREIPMSDLPDAAVSSTLDVVGLIPRLQVTRVVIDSPADEAGVKVGDIVLRYHETETPTVGQILELNTKRQGDATLLRVLRQGREIDLKITPGSKDKRALIGISQTTDADHLVVAEVRPGSMAARAGINPETNPRVVAVNGQPVTTWKQLIDRLGTLAGQEVSVTLEVAGKPQTVVLGKLNETEFSLSDYEYSIPSVTALKPLIDTVQQSNFFYALGNGVQDTYGLLIGNYGSLQSLFRGRVSTGELRGPLGIGALALERSREGWDQLIFLMTFLSVALAVFNFLPLPVLDGGMAAMLIIEKLRGKPLPIKAINIIQLCGLIFILLLFVALLFQDVMRIIAGLWT